MKNIIVASFFLTVAASVAIIGWGNVVGLIQAEWLAHPQLVVEQFAKWFCKAWLIIGVLYGSLGLVFGGSRTVVVANLDNFFHRKPVPPSRLNRGAVMAACVFGVFTLGIFSVGMLRVDTRDAPAIDDLTPIAPLPSLSK